MHTLGQVAKEKPSSQIQHNYSMQLKSVTSNHMGLLEYLCVFNVRMLSFLLQLSSCLFNFKKCKIEAVLSQKV